MQESKTAHTLLKRLALEDPRGARRLFVEIFEANTVELQTVIQALRRPGEGRLRQVVASALRTHPDKSRFVGEFVRWRATETDEFTRRAIEGALAGVDEIVLKAPGSPAALGAPSEVGVAYRYVADRLRHRLSNAMLPAQTQVSRLRRKLGDSTDADILGILGKLTDAINLMGRALEVTSVDPDHFRQQPIILNDWLLQLHARYSAQYASISFKLNYQAKDPARVFGSEYLLETLFMNLWLNAHQAVGPTCEIMMVLNRVRNEIEILLSDNGEGFPPDLKDVVFQQVYSTKDQGRGRGMLEVQDAVERLAGRIELHQTSSKNYRLKIYLPWCQL